MKRAVLILSDGMRPDAVLACGHPLAEKLIKEGKTTLKGTSVIPPVTLPCHMSLVHSVDPDRHGVITNTYSVPVRPINGLFEVLCRYDKKCAFFYGWGQLKDIYQPSSLADVRFVSCKLHGLAESNNRLTAACVQALREGFDDFLFLYLPEVDEVGHKSGWMSEAYIRAVYHSFENIQAVYDELGPDDVLLITADHGGHERRHGENIPEDMTIPFFAYGKPFGAGTEFTSMNLKDIAPTVTALFGLPADEDWEGSSLL